MKGPVDGLIYLLISGIGCIAGMMLASSLFNTLFSKKIVDAWFLQSFLMITSSLLCILYGTNVIYENLIV